MNVKKLFRMALAACALLTGFAGTANAEFFSHVGDSTGAPTWDVDAAFNGAGTVVPYQSFDFHVDEDGRYKFLAAARFDEGTGVLWQEPVAGVEARPQLLSPAGPALESALWQWSDVRSGVATLTQPVVEAFVPQMLNYESVGGVNFKKGCYPGQEVVARSQFRGTLKRRAFVAHAPAELAAGQEVFAAADPEQPAGIVAQAAPAPDGGWEAIVSLQLAAVEAGDLHVASADGPALRLRPLPYELLADI